jgi:hypothetical protein
MLAVVALNCSVYGFLSGLTCGDGIEPWRLAWSRCAAPVDHVAIVAAIGVQGQPMIGKEAPPFSIGRHRPQSNPGRKQLAGPGTGTLTGGFES